jgi:hypothetical protein
MASDASDGAGELAGLAFQDSFEVAAWKRLAGFISILVKKFAR